VQRNDPAIESALRHADLGIPVLPTRGKVPAIDDWRNQASTNIDRITNWARMATPSFGAVCKKIAVVDTDTPELARWWYRNMPKTPWMVRTPSGGGHFYYSPGDAELRCAVKVNGKWDVRAGGTGYVIIAGSQLAKNKIYELIGQMTLDLPMFDPAWLPA